MGECPNSSSRRSGESSANVAIISTPIVPTAVFPLRQPTIARVTARPTHTTAPSGDRRLVTSASVYAPVVIRLNR